VYSRQALPNVSEMMPGTGLNEETAPFFHAVLTRDSMETVVEGMFL